MHEPPAVPQIESHGDEAQIEGTRLFDRVAVVGTVDLMDGKTSSAMIDEVDLINCHRSPQPRLARVLRGARRFAGGGSAPA